MRSSNRESALFSKFSKINWILVLLICCAGSLGFATLYSSAGGDLHPWALPQIVRFSAGFFIMIIFALIDINFWFRNAYIIYFILFLAVLSVEFFGISGMGAKRWVDLGITRIQPSEMMKLGLLLAISRYFHGLSMDQVKKTIFLFVPIILVILPTIVVLSQPDLGTGVILILIGISIFFIAGVQIWKFILVLIASVIATPYLWNFLHSYQQERILAFFNPDKDPLGSGYQIAQSKIAMGSGGVSGKGFLEGTQSHLHFLPETQTDFAFTMIAEEFGFVGGLVLLAIYIMILIYVFSIAMRSKNHFGRMVAIGVSTAFFLYFFINIAMVTGLIPIVGVPLPFISYGGSSLITLMASFGIVMSVYVHRDIDIDPFGRRI